jgi:hypothetical protein
LEKVNSASNDERIQLLKPFCKIVMDNASFHKRADSQQLIEQAGHLVEFLPPYSPDLNPVEHKWAQSKALRRQKIAPLRSCLPMFFESFYYALAISVAPDFVVGSSDVLIGLALETMLHVQHLYLEFFALFLRFVAQGYSLLCLQILTKMMSSNRNGCKIVFSPETQYYKAWFNYI